MHGAEGMAVRGIRVFGLVLVLAAVAFGSGQATPAQAESPPVFDYLFLVDTSGSMMGLGEGTPAVILPQVKAAIVDTIGGLADGANVAILSFHQGVAAEKDFALDSTEVREAAIEYVNGLEANGTVTWVWDSLQTALKRVDALRTDGREHVQTILLFTDGLDNSSRGVSLADIVQQFGLLKSENENLWLKYVTLGVDLPEQDAQTIGATPGMEVIDNPRGELKPIYTVEVRPLVLDFGNMAGVETATASLKLSFPEKATGLSYTVTARAERLSNIGVEPLVEVQSSGLAELGTLTLSLLNRQSMLAGDAEYEGVLELVSDEGLVFSPPSIPFKFRLREQPVVSVKPALLADENPDLGVLSLENGAFTPGRHRWNARFSRTDGGGSVTLHVQPIPGNPGELDPSALQLLTSSGRQGQEVELLPTDEWVEVTIAPQAGLIDGQYSVAVVAEPHDVSLEWAELTTLQAFPGEQALALQFSLPKPPEPPNPPTPAWVWIVIAVGVVAVLLIAYVIVFRIIVGRWPWKKLVLPSCMLYVDRGLPGESGTEIGLEGRTSVSVGKDSEYLPDASAKVEIRPERERRGICARLYVLEGDVRFRSSSERETVPIENELLYDGDRIYLGDTHILRVQSFDLVRD
jgi:hypothetical protein